MKGLYLLINLCTVSVPLIFSFHPKLNFYKKWKSFFIANTVTAFLFILWDILFTHLGVWGFNPDYLLGIYVFNLPLEEILFFVCIPYACVFTYHCLKIFFKPVWPAALKDIFFLLLLHILIITGFLHLDKLYTASTCLSLALLLIVIRIQKADWIFSLFSFYPLLLVPFFIVNGILTGTGIDAPVVWYNDLENISIRLGSIPIEDVFYGFEMILLNVFIFEALENKNKKEMQTI